MSTTITVVYADEASALYVDTELVGVGRFDHQHDDNTVQDLADHFGWQVEVVATWADNVPFDVYAEEAWPKFLPDFMLVNGQQAAQAVSPSEFFGRPQDEEE